MAHRCWAFDDIVRTIAAILVTNWATRSAVALARCSRSLEEPALGEVWRSLRSLVPLIKCFPPEVWELVDNKLAFKRAPLQAEWTRFQERYASKVRYQYVDLRLVKSFPGLHVLQLHCRGNPLLPNLVSLTWVSNETYLPFILPLISPSLASIAIEVRGTASPMLPPIIDKISTLNIREIEIKTLEYDSPMEEASSQLLLQCSRDLRKFKVDSPISTSALRHIIQLPSLEELLLVFNAIQLPNPLPLLVFPSLRRLELNWYARDDSWLKLLPAIENPVLKTIHLNCSASDVDWCMEAFQLTITQCAMCECLQEFWLGSPTPDELEITPRIIGYSLFKNLTSLKLGYEAECFESCQTYNVTCNDIDLLTKAMPSLECLVIGGDPCAVRSRIPFQSLYTISHRCPRLTVLQIHFDPASLMIDVSWDREPWNAPVEWADSKTLPSDLCSVTTINIGDIPLPDNPTAPCAMALGLLGVFPCLVTLQYDESENGLWGRVEDMIEVCRSLGRFAFGKG